MNLSVASPTSASGPNASFTGNVVYSLMDVNADGIAEALVADVEVEILVAGTYFVDGALMKGGTLVSDRPSWNAMNPNIGKAVSGNPGLHTVQLQFSGEEIFQSGLDGPYELDLALLSDLLLEDQIQDSTPAYTSSQFGELSAALTGSVDQGEDLDADGKFDVLRASVTVEVRVPGDYLLAGTLWKDDQTLVDAIAPVQESLGAGVHVLTLDFNGSVLRRSAINGPYTLHLTLMDTNTFDAVDRTFDTQFYDFNDFELSLITPDGSFNDQGIDTNSNGLFDLLRIAFGADVQTAGDYLVSGQLTGPGGEFVAFTETPMNLDTGPQTLTLDFLGPVIREQGIDGPYQVEVVVWDQTSFDELDRVVVGTSQGFSHTDFDPFELADIELTGNSNDFGVDTNNNGLFDELHVEVEVALTTSDFYEWSASLVDVNGTEIDFDSRSGSLSAGLATINFIFDGQKIGANGVNGPYFVKALLMFGQTGPNAVIFDVAETQAFTASQFEGFTPPAEADLSLTKTATPDPVTVGQNLRYDLTVINNGPSDATGVTLVDNLPAGITFVSATTSQGSCAEAGGVVTCDLGSLANGANATVTIVVTVNSGPSVTNMASVSGNEADPDTTNNNASTDTTVNPAPIANIFFVSSNVSGKVSGLKYQDEDVIAFVPTNSAWSMYFDGSDVGLKKTDVDCFDIVDPAAEHPTLLLSFDKAIKIPSLGWVDDSDIVAFTFTAAPGPNTSGTFAWYFDGSDVRLNRNGEDVDACDWTADGKLVLSTSGSFSVPGLSGQDEDLFTFTPNPGGVGPDGNTAGTFALFLDGTVIGLRREIEDVKAVWVDPISPSDTYLATLGKFTANSGANTLSGKNNDVFGCSQTSTTSCDALFILLNGDSVGFTTAIDGLNAIYSPNVTAALSSTSRTSLESGDNAVQQYDVIE